MKYSLIILCVLFCSVHTIAQNNVGIGTNNPRNSAILDLYSQNQGLLLPRVDTVNITGLGALDHGLMVYDTTMNKILIYNGASWESAAGSSDLNGLSDVNITSPAPNNFLRYIGGQWINTSSIFPINETVATAGTQFQLNHIGLGNSFRVTNTSPFASDYVISGEALGDAIAGYFVNNQATATNQALYTHTLGSGPAMVGLGLSNTATAARFANTTPGNTQPTLILENAGTGLGLNVVSGGVQVNEFGGGGQKMIITDNNGLLDTAAITSSPWVDNTGSIFYNSGDVGIGIASPTPQARLNVVSTAFLNTQLESNNDNGTWLSMNNSSTGGQWFHIVSTGATNSEGAGKLIFNRGTAQGTSGGNILTLDHASSNIGIGTSSPNARLQINSALSATALRLTNDATGTATTDGLLFSTNSAGIANIRNRENANMFIGTNNLIGQLVLAPTGNVGIGTSSPVNQLEVIGDAAKFDSVIIVNGAQTGYVLTAADATGAASWQPTSGGNSWDLLGNVGTNPASDFLGTTDNTSLVLRTNNTAKLTINPNGDIDMIGAELRMFDGALGFGTTKIVNTGIGGLIEGYDPAHSIYLRTGFDGSSDRLELHEFGTIGFYTGGAIGSQVERIHIGSTGNIGIGTSSPANKLEVIGDAAKFDSVIIANNAQAGYVLTAADATGAASWQPTAGGVSGTGATNKLAYWSAANTLAFNTGLHYESASQRLGLGTSAPAEFLHVNSGNPITVASRFTNASTGSTGSDGFGFGITGTGNAFINNDEATPINISTASVTRMTIGSTGNIGIGTTVPTSRLEVNGDIRLSNGANRTIVMTPEPNSADPFSLTIKGSNSTIGAAARNGGHLVMEAGHNYNISIPTSTPGHVYLRSGGNIFGPGGNSPAGDIHLQTGGLAGNPNIYDERMIIKGSGNIGIGTSAPAAKLDLIGNIKITDGTQAFGRVLTSDANGLASWQPAASSPWTLNATDVFYTAGNVGIGTNAPNAPLQFSNALAPRKIVLFEATNNDHQYFGFGVTGSELRYQINSPASHVFYASSSATTSTELMRISSNGNVGIGTAAPSNILSLGSATNQKIWIENSVGAATPGRDLTLSAGTSSLGFNNINGGNLILQAGAGTGTGTSSILFQNGTTLGNTPAAQTMTTKMAILGNGNVGIGTNTPSYKLDVVGDNGVRIAPAAGGENFLTLVNASTSTPSWGINDNTNRDLAFYRYDNTGFFLNTSLLIQNSTGNVGIGRDNISLNPTTALYVAENNGNGPVATFRNTYGGGPVAPQGISIIFDDNDLGGNRYITFQRAGIGEIGSVQGSNGSVFYATTSDRRLKTKIDDFGGALEMVKNLKPRQYAYKVNPDRLEYGFIAQELQLVIPQMVSGSPDGDVSTNPMMVDYSRITPVLTKAIQEQQLLIENQQKIIDSQKAELEELKSSNNDLKSTDKNTQVQLDLMKAQIERLNTILSAEASK